jgi:hypothetical protein
MKKVFEEPLVSVLRFEMVDRLTADEGFSSMDYDEGIGNY